MTMFHSPFAQCMFLTNPFINTSQCVTHGERSCKHVLPWPSVYHIVKDHVCTYWQDPVFITHGEGSCTHIDMTQCVEKLCTHLVIWQTVYHMWSHVHIQWHGPVCITHGERLLTWTSVHATHNEMSCTHHVYHMVCIIPSVYHMVTGHVQILWHDQVCVIWWKVMCTRIDMTQCVSHMVKGHVQTYWHAPVWLTWWKVMFKLIDMTQFVSHMVKGHVHIYWLDPVCITHGERLYTHILTWPSVFYTWWKVMCTLIDMTQYVLLIVKGRVHILWHDPFNMPLPKIYSEGLMGWPVESDNKYVTVPL